MSTPRPTCKGCQHFARGFDVMQPYDFVLPGESHCSNRESPKYLRLVTRFDSCACHEPLPIVTRVPVAEEKQRKLSPGWTLLIILAPWLLVGLWLVASGRSPLGAIGG